jgi:hypothetical protein
MAAQIIGFVFPGQTISDSRLAALVLDMGTGTYVFSKDPKGQIVATLVAADDELEGWNKDSPAEAALAVGRALAA